MGVKLIEKRYASLSLKMEGIIGVGVLFVNAEETEINRQDAKNAKFKAER